MNKNTYICESCGLLGGYINNKYQFCPNGCDGPVRIFNLDKDDVIRPERENPFGKGYILGYQEGREKGYTIGYENGYNHGYKRAVYELTNKCTEMIGE